jgi:hypothetical protein
MGSRPLARSDALWAVLLVGGLVLSFVAYDYPPYPFNPYEAVASLAFWTGAFLALGRSYLRGTLTIASKAVRTARGASVAVVYIFVHLLLYGFVLEGIFAYVYQTPTTAASPYLYVSSNLFYPLTAVNAFAGLTFSPSVTVVVPPIFGASLSSFSIFIAVIIDLLIVANIGKIGEIGRVVPRVMKTKAYFAMPLIGIVAGASCCMSLPSLLTVAAPGIISLPSFVWAFYIAYFGFPLLALVLLKMNLDVATRIVSKLTIQGTASLP